MKSTKNCVFCLTEPAVSWGGHVKKASEILLAGWCEEHSTKRSRRNREYDNAAKNPDPTQGFVGHYLGSMGAFE